MNPTEETARMAYEGTELDFFNLATHWKRYVGDSLREWIGGDVLEVGAGIGGKTEALMRGDERSWTCLEPDHALAARIDERHLPCSPAVITGTTADLDPELRYDSILYVDVLEHIEDDAGEVERAVARLKPGGHLVTLSPAYEALRSPFDDAVGHFRRYRRSTLLALRPSGCEVRAAFYLDSLGAILSAGNRALLKSSAPSREQILFWDRRVVPVSRAIMDRLLRRRVGRSVVVVWQRSG